MADKALVVYTGKSRERLIAEGGSAHWVLSPAVVRGFEYIVCVRHAHPPYDPGPGLRLEPHRSAFLVARIADLMPTGRVNGRDRYRVMFEAVADVQVANFWDGSRNPVRYMPLTDVKARGIDFETLTFEKVAPVEIMEGEDVAAAEEGGIIPLTIAEAKDGLAAMFGVPPDAIEITIKG